MKKTLATLGATLFLSLAAADGNPLTLEAEGMVLKPYYDSVGIRTVCGGETVYVEEKEYSKAECIDLFGVRYGYYSRKVLGMYSQAAAEVVTPKIHAAVTDLAYNVGPGAVRRSKLMGYLNSGRPEKACDAFTDFKYAGGRDCSLEKGKPQGCYGVWDRRLKAQRLCRAGLQ